MGSGGRSRQPTSAPEQVSTPPQKSPSSQFQGVTRGSQVQPSVHTEAMPSGTGGTARPQVLVLIAVISQRAVTSRAFEVGLKFKSCLPHLPCHLGLSVLTCKADSSESLSPGVV